MISKRHFEQALQDLLRELEACPAWLQVEMIVGLMAETGCSEDEAIRQLARMETTAREILEASRSIGDA